MKRTGIAVLAVLFSAGGWAAGGAGAQAPTKNKPKQQKHAAPAAPAGVKLAAQMPPGGKARPYHFPKAETRTLPNGVRVFVVQSKEVPAVTVQLVLPDAGSVHDPAGEPGVAAMTANLLTQGTEKRTAQQIAEAIDFVGGSLSANAGDDTTSVRVTVVKKDFALGMDLLSDVVLHPAFREQELQRRRQQLLSGLRVQYSDAQYLASAIFSRVVYGPHPYGMPNEGTPDSVRALKRDTLVRFHQTYYVPNGALLAFAGDITPEAAFAAAAEYFGAWPKKEISEASVPAQPPAKGLHVYLIDKPDAVQTQIRVGRPGIRRNDPDYIPLFVTNRIFGGGFNSRLSTEVRQKKGLTYGANSAFVSEKLAGSFVASTFTRTDATVEATKLVVDLIARMATGEVTQKELDFARDYLAGVFPIQSETTGQVARQILSLAIYGLPADYYDTYQSKILGVSAEQVKTIAGKYFDPANLDVVLVGNVAQVRDALKKDFPQATFVEFPADDVDLLAPDLRKPKKEAAEATPESLAQGKQILAAAAQAAGAEALGKVADVEVSVGGNLFIPQGEAAVDSKIVVLYPDHLRAETTLPFGVLKQGFDGKKGWVASPQGVMALPESFIAELQRSVDLLGGWGLYRKAAAGQAEAQALGEEEVQGHRAFAVLWTEGAEKVKLYFDPESHLLVGARYQQKTMQGAVETLQTWSDFRDVEGAKFPYHNVVFRDGQKFSETSVKEIKVNTKPEPAVFEKPAQ